MIALLAALVVSLAPQPPVGPGDDFNDVISNNEKQLHCEAVSLYRSDPDTVRLIVFRCADGDYLVPFAYQGPNGWFPVQREWKLETAAKSPGSPRGSGLDI